MEVPRDKVELLSWGEKRKEKWEMSAAEKIAAAAAAKAKVATSYESREAT